MTSVPIYFYLHPHHFPPNIPEDIHQNWPGFGLGIYAWTIQTYLRLKQDGFPCFLTSKIPDQGIVFIHRNLLTRYHSRFKPSQNLLLICLKAELSPYPYGQLQIVQNPTEIETVSHSFYLPHWTQPGLIPRDLSRGDRFENIAFFGHQNNLAAELLSPRWQQHLNQLGLNWLPVINRNPWNDYQTLNPAWNDYRHIDAIVAIRRFGTDYSYPNKPATKLYNAWLAGVPAILGYESAYRTEGHPHQDYLEVTSFSELSFTLKQLKQDIKLRQKIVNQGDQQGQKFHPDQITQRWRNFIETVAIPAFETWYQTPRWLQQLILEKQALSGWIERGKAKLKVQPYSNSV